MKGKNIYIKINYVQADTLKEAISRKGTLAHIITATKKEATTLLESIGVEVDRTLWSDLEEPVEMGYKTFTRKSKIVPKRAKR